MVFVEIYHTLESTGSCLFPKRKCNNSEKVILREKVFKC